MTFPHFVRRLHLYLGMFLLPWFFMYGVSSIPFSHAPYFQQKYGPPQFTLRFDRPYEIEVPPDADLREIGARIVADNGLKGAFGAYRPDAKRINVYVHDFWSATNVTYFVEEKRLRAEDRGFRWQNFLTGLHARGGFEQDSILHDAWGVVVDIVCVGFILWIATGLYMWWQLPQSRGWGWVAVAAGAASFVWFLAAL